MPIRVEIFAAAGIAIGVIPRSGHVRKLLEAAFPVQLEGASWNPLDASAPPGVGDLAFAPDDIHIAVSDEPDDGPMHAQWHDVVLDLGPYRIRGQMPTMPGFDPGRALARPTGEFVQLRDVTIELIADADGGGLARPMALVNRYVVDRVEADLMLGFFFPGATMVASAGPESAAVAGQPVPPASTPAPAPVATAASS
jgi:hypothetical protein